MTELSALDRVSRAELERFRRMLTYAQVQLCKRGEYEAVVRSLRRRTWIALCVTLGTGAVAIVGVVAFIPWTGLLSWLLILYVLLFALFNAYQHIQARRTAEIVDLLMEERKRLAGA